MTRITIDLDDEDEALIGRLVDCFDDEPVVPGTVASIIVKLRTALGLPAGSNPGTSSQWTVPS